jgi:hypothetical protein
VSVKEVDLLPGHLAQSIASSTTSSLSYEDYLAAHIYPPGITLSLDGPSDDALLMILADSMLDVFWIDRYYFIVA